MREFKDESYLSPHSALLFPNYFAPYGWLAQEAPYGVKQLRRSHTYFSKAPGILDCSACIAGSNEPEQLRPETLIWWATVNDHKDGVILWKLLPGWKSR